MLFRSVSARLAWVQTNKMFQTLFVSKLKQVVEKFNKNYLKREHEVNGHLVDFQQGPQEKGFQYEIDDGYLSETSSSSSSCDSMETTNMLSSSTSAHNSPVQALRSASRVGSGGVTPQARRRHTSQTQALSPEQNIDTGVSPNIQPGMSQKLTLSAKKIGAFIVDRGKKEKCSDDKYWNFAVTPAPAPQECQECDQHAALVKYGSPGSLYRRGVPGVAGSQDSPEMLQRTRLENWNVSSCFPTQSGGPPPGPPPDIPADHPDLQPLDQPSDIPDILADPPVSPLGIQPVVQHPDIHQVLPEVQQAVLGKVAHSPLGVGPTEESTPPSAGRGRGRGSRHPGEGSPVTPGPSFRAQTPRNLHPEEQDKELVIFTDPSRWQVNEPAQQTVDLCRQPFLSKLANLHNMFVEEQIFDWDNDNFQQLFAMSVLRIARTSSVSAGRLIPCAIESYDLDDYFEHGDDGFIVSSDISLNAGNVLTGVNSGSPEQMFTFEDHVAVQERSPEVYLRSSQVNLVHLLNDLRGKKMRVTVVYTYGENDEGQPIKQTYDNTLIQGRLHAAVSQVSEVLNSVYFFQGKAKQLAQALTQLSDEHIEDVEAQICSFVLTPALSDVETMKGIHNVMMARLNNLKRCLREYEAAAVEGADDNVLSQAYVEKQFKDLPTLIQFLNNSSSLFLNYIKFPGRWTTQKSQCKISTDSLKVTASPSRLFIPKAFTPIDSIVARVKQMMDHLLKEIVDFQKSSSQVHPFHEVGSSNKVPDLHEASAAYPTVLLEDADQLVLSIRNLHDIKTVSLSELESLDKTAQSITQALQTAQWQKGVILKSQHKELEVYLKESKSFLAEAISEKKAQLKLKDIEAREISKTLSTTPDVKLDKQGENVLAFIEYHDQFKSVNKLQRSLKIKSGLLNTQLKERVQHESNPEVIIELIKKLYLAEDIVIPKARAQIESLKSSPPINSRDEGAAYSEILGFISKLKKAELMERLDFSTITLAISKVSKTRQDQWEQKWLLTQMELEGLPLRVMEEKKRTMFIQYIEFNESLIHRRLLQTAVQEKGEKPKDKVKTEKVFSTVSDLRKTKFDHKKDKKTGQPSASSRQKGQYECPLCGLKNGHPRTQDGPKKGSGAKSLARCPEFKNTAQPQKLALVFKLASCARCLSTTHEVESCFLSPAVPWLEHDNCDQGKLGAHNPTICPKRQPPAKVSA